MSTIKISEKTCYELKRFNGYILKQEYADASVTGYRTYLSRFLRQTVLPQADTLKEAIGAFLETERVNNPRTFNHCRAALRLYYKMVAGGNLKSSYEALLVEDPMIERNVRTLILRRENLMKNIWEKSGIKMTIASYVDDCDGIVIKDEKTAMIYFKIGLIMQKDFVKTIE